MLFPKISDQEYETLWQVAGGLEISPDWLYSLIDFESKWDPQARNPISGARGLIQFTNTTARSVFGFTGADQLVQKFPDRISQLVGPVYNYLKNYKPYPTQQSLAMAVFYPAYRNVSPDTAFPADVTAVNPGINTVNDYLKKVFPTINIVASLAIIGGVAAAAYLIYSFSQRG